MSKARPIPQAQPAPPAGPDGGAGAHPVPAGGKAVERNGGGSPAGAPGPATAAATPAGAPGQARAGAAAAHPAPTGAAAAAPAPGATAAAETDARLLNWRLVVPSEPDGLLLLAAAGETLPGTVRPARDAAGLAAALDGRSYPAVVVGDLGAWARLDGAAGAAALLGRAAAAVAPGGWLYAGFANRLYPAGLRDRGALRVGAAWRALAAAGLEPAAAYLTFPDQRCPAYLVGTAGSAELDYFLRTLFFPHANASSALKARVKQRALALGRLAALATPPRLRPLFAPAYGLVACRPPAPGS